VKRRKDVGFHRVIFRRVCPDGRARAHARQREVSRRQIHGSLESRSRRIPPTQTLASTTNRSTIVQPSRRGSGCTFVRLLALARICCIFSGVRFEVRGRVRAKGSLHPGAKLSIAFVSSHAAQDMLRAKFDSEYQSRFPPK